MTSPITVASPPRNANAHDKMTAVTTMVIVDDETLVRYGFELILGAAPDIEVVATTGDVDAV